MTERAASAAAERTAGGADPAAAHGESTSRAGRTPRPASRAAHRVAQRGTPAQRVRAWLVRLAAWLIALLPEAATIRVADLAGWLWYRATPDRATLARRQLGRVATALDERGIGPPRARTAATDRDALERLVRDAYRHAARYYLEMIRVGRWTPALVRERMLVETPDVVEEAFSRPGSLIVVGMHFGAIEMPAIYLAQRSGRPATVPMESIADPELQRWIVDTRGRVGMRIIALADARRELTAALARGELVGLVADRDIAGGGLPVPLFGHAASLPIGPAMLALESGAPLYVASARREGPGRYRGRMERIEVPATGTRRERLTATLGNLAAAFEATVALAPEQWWGVFHPIWPDLAEVAVPPTAEPAA